MAMIVSGGPILHEGLARAGAATQNERLLAWFSFMLAFALIAGTAAILFWWRNAQIRSLLEHLNSDLERAALRHRFEALLRQSLDVVVLLAEDGTIIEVNDRVWEYYGRSPEELRGRHVGDLRCPSCRDLLAGDSGICWRAITTGSPAPVGRCLKGCICAGMGPRSQWKSARGPSAIRNAVISNPWFGIFPSASKRRPRSRFRNCAFAPPSNKRRSAWPTSRLTDAGCG